MRGPVPRKSLALLLLPLCTGPLQSLAQSPAAAPASNPLDSLPQLPTAPAVRPPVQLQLEAPPPQAEAILRQNVQAQRFDIQGSTAVPFEQVAAIFSPWIGQTVTVAQLVQGANQVTTLYQQQGYALSFAYIPPQNFANGVVRVIVVEGYLQQLQIEGQSGKSEALIREYAQPLLTERPLRTATFEHQTQLMARLPGVRVTASAQLPKTTDGATPLVLKVSHQPVTFSLGGDLRQPRSRAIATLTLNDPLWEGSQLQFSSLLRQPSEERFLSAGFTQLLNASGTLLRASYSDFRGQDTNLPSTVDAITDQRKLEVSLQHPLRLGARESAFVSGGLYGINYGKEYDFPTLGLNVLDRERVRTLFGQFNWNQAQGTVTRTASVLLARGLDALGAGFERSNSANLPMAANPAKLDFTRLTADYSQRHRFASQWGAAFALGGQYSPDVLPVPERISFGGTRFGRGYQSGEFAGDSGLGASVELNYAFRLQTRWIKSLEPYLLYEQARTWQQRSGVATAQLKSTSLGLRLGDGRYYALDIAVSKPQGDAAFSNPERKERFSMVLSYQLDL